MHIHFISFALVFQITSASLKFSGVYSSQDEIYGAAFLISKHRLLNARKNIVKAYFPEEHLSSSSNGAGSNKELLRILNKRMNITADMIEKTDVSLSQNQAILQQTLAVIPFSDDAANLSNQDESAVLHRKIRISFFRATFYSLYRYFKHIVVFVASERDRKIVEQLGIPYWRLVDLASTLEQVPKDEYFFHDSEHKEPRPRNQLLPKFSLLYVLDKLNFRQEQGTREAAESEVDAKEEQQEEKQEEKLPWTPTVLLDPEWHSMFEFVYYTEGDQILHMRNHENIYSIVTNSNNRYCFIPHRLQTVPLYQTFPTFSSPQSLSPPPSGTKQRMQRPPPVGHWPLPKITNVTLVTESGGAASVGSCCDNGRMALEDCGGIPWYYCPTHGLKNHTTWVRFGPHGMTMPLSTEHKGVCSYSRVRVLCAMPAQCSHRVPLKVTDNVVNFYDHTQKYDLMDYGVCPELEYSAN